MAQTTKHQHSQSKGLSACLSRGMTRGLEELDLGGRVGMVASDEACELMLGELVSFLMLMKLNGSLLWSRDSFLPILSASLFLLLRPLESACWLLLEVVRTPPPPPPLPPPAWVEDGAEGVWEGVDEGGVGCEGEGAPLMGRKPVPTTSDDDAGPFLPGEKKAKSLGEESEESNSGS